MSTTDTDPTSVVAWDIHEHRIYGAPGETRHRVLWVEHYRRDDGTTPDLDSLLDAARSGGIDRGAKTIHVRPLVYGDYPSNARATSIDIGIYTEEARRLALCLIKDRPIGMTLAEAGKVILDALGGNTAAPPAHQRVADWAHKEGITFVSRSYGQHSTTTISAEALERLAGGA